MSLIPTNSPSICMTIENAYRQYARATSPRIDPTETSRDFPLPNNYEGYPSWYPIWPECDMPSCRTGNLCSTTGRKVRPFAEHTIYVRHGQQRRCRCQPGAHVCDGTWYNACRACIRTRQRYIAEIVDIDYDIQSKHQLLDLAETLLFGSPKEPGLGPILTAHINRQKALVTFANNLLFDNGAFCGLLANYLLAKERKAQIREVPAPLPRLKRAVRITAYRDRVPTITFPQEAPFHPPSPSNPLRKVWPLTPFNPPSSSSPMMRIWPSTPLPTPRSYANAVAGPSRMPAQTPTPNSANPTGTQTTGRADKTRTRKKRRTNPPHREPSPKV